MIHVLTDTLACATFSSPCIRCGLTSVTSAGASIKKKKKKKEKLFHRDAIYFENDAFGIKSSGTWFIIMVHSVEQVASSSLHIWECCTILLVLVLQSLLIKLLTLVAMHLKLW